MPLRAHALSGACLLGEPTNERQALRGCRTGTRPAAGPKTCCQQRTVAQRASALTRPAPFISIGLLNRNPKEVGHSRLLMSPPEDGWTLESARRSVLSVAACAWLRLPGAAAVVPGPRSRRSGGTAKAALESDSVKRSCEPESAHARRHVSRKARRLLELVGPEGLTCRNGLSGYRRGGLPKENATRCTSHGLPEEAVEGSRRRPPWKQARRTAPRRGP
jgi:hypothetical protein